jgi:hypothetical protein
MALSQEQRERVRQVLLTEPFETLAERVASLLSAEELHQFAMNYNCNDGFLPLWALLRDPLLDRGTALYVYWLFEYEVWLPSAQRKRREDADWDVAGLLAEIEERMTSGAFHRERIAYDPNPGRDWNSVRQYRIRKLREAGQLPFPEVMLEATPGEQVEQEWLV